MDNLPICFGQGHSALNCFRSAIELQDELKTIPFLSSVKAPKYSCDATASKGFITLEPLALLKDFSPNIAVLQESNPELSQVGSCLEGEILIPLKSQSTTAGRLWLTVVDQRWGGRIAWIPSGFHTFNHPFIGFCSIFAPREVDMSKLDADGDGQISKEELEKALVNLASIVHCQPTWD